MTDDIRQWLENLGLGKYGDAFVENEFRVNDLFGISDPELKELGLPMGPRRRILMAIDSIREVAITPEAARSEAERRQLTVMFVDLVGSTAIAEMFDPEDFRNLIRGYQETCAGVVSRFEGHIAKYLGDGILVYFGYPQAHEDDVQRALYAGLEIVGAITRIETPQVLQVRIGIATGLVVAGDLVGEGVSEEQAVLGGTPNLAARLQTLAEINSVVIAPSTRRLGGGAFEYTDLGKHSLKGFSEPVRAWRVDAARTTESRFEAAIEGRLTELVGRDQEVAELEERWRQAKAGCGQVVLLSGEAGIGKSRVSQVLRQRISDEPHTRLRYQCSPYQTNAAAYPIIAQLEHAAGLGRDDDEDVKLDKLDALLSQSAKNGARVKSLFAALLSLPTERYPPLEFSPERQKQETIGALVDQVSALATQQPLLLIFEDAHWCDPTSLEVMSAVIDRILAEPVLVVITHRPEFAPPWADRPHVTVRSLDRLAGSESAAMVTNVTGGKLLPDEVLDQIVAKTDGVPLFVEELTKTVLEAGFLRETPDGFALDGHVPPLAIPATLQDSLTARLDRLSPVKEVAQIGACIGREFSYDLLAAVSPLGDNELRDALQQLVNSELLSRRGSNWTFKHALVQDSAYESLLISKRIQLHGRLAAVMEADVTVESADIARHFAAAEMPEKAAKHYFAAGQKFLQVTALVEAEAQLRLGLSEAEKVTDLEKRDRLELDVRLALGTTCMALHGWPSQLVLDALLPAVPLAKKLRDNDALAPVLWGIWLCETCRCNLEPALSWITEFDQAAGRDNATPLALIRDMAGVCNYMWLGRFEKALRYKATILETYDYSLHGQITHFTLHDPKVITLQWAGSILLWILGYPEQALTEQQEALEHARRIEHPFHMVFSLSNGSYGLLFRGEYDRLIAQCDEAESIAVEENLQFAKFVLAQGMRARAQALKGDSEGSMETLLGVISLWESLGGELTAVEARATIALALHGVGRTAEARKLIGHAIERAEVTHERWTLADAYRVKGDLLRDGPSSDLLQAEACYRKAIEIAQQQKAKSWELRAAMGLARLLSGERKNGEATAILEPVYNWFTEGFDTKDLRTAKQVLEELG